MKRKLSLLLVAIMVVLSLTACGGSKKIDVASLGKDLTGTITSELSEVNADIIANTFFVDMSKVSESVAYLNSGANACEVVVLKCSDSSYAKEAKELFENRVEIQSSLFASYNADEVAKLDSAIIKVSGNYVVYCVSDDSASAEKIVKDAGI